jgi:hypothetical protein
MVNEIEWKIIIDVSYTFGAFSLSNGRDSSRAFALSLTVASIVELESWRSNGSFSFSSFSARACRSSLNLRYTR